MSFFSQFGDVIQFISKRLLRLKNDSLVPPNLGIKSLVRERFFDS